VAALTNPGRSGAKPSELREVAAAFTEVSYLTFRMDSIGTRGHGIPGSARWNGGLSRSGVAADLGAHHQALRKRPIGIDEQVNNAAQ
jgi:hypothetical protein